MFRIFCEKCDSFVSGSNTIVFAPFYGPFGSSSYSPILQFYGNNFRRFLIVMTISHSSWLCCTPQQPAPKICGFGRHINSKTKPISRAPIIAIIAKLPIGKSRAFSYLMSAPKKAPENGCMQCNFRETDRRMSYLSIYTFFAKVLLWVEWLLRLWLPMVSLSSTLLVADKNSSSEWSWFIAGTRM